MDFSHTPTFLRSAMLEDPFCLGDQLGPEDVLRIQVEYPDLFTNNSRNAIPYKLTRENTGTASASTLDRLSQPKVTCTRPHHNRITQSVQRKTFSRPKSIMPVKKNIKVQQGFPVIQSQSAPDQNSLNPPLTASKASKSEPLLLPSNTSTRRDMNLIHAATKATRHSRSPVTSQTNDLATRLLHARTAGRARSASEKTTPKLPPVEKRYRTSASAVLKPVPSPMTTKKLKLSSKSSLLMELTELRKSDTFSKRSKTLDAAVEPKTVVQAVKKRAALEKLEKIVFQLPETMKSPSTCETEGPKASEWLDDSASDASPSSNETQTLTQGFLRIGTQGEAPVLSTEEAEEQLTKESMNRCEQFLLAKYLALKYEKEGIFKRTSVADSKPLVPANKKRVRINSAPHQTYTSTEQFRKSTQVPRMPSRLKEETSNLLLRECESIVRSECLKILDEMKDSLKKRPTSVSTEPYFHEKSGHFQSESYAEESGGNNGGKSSESQSVPTPTLTPPSVEQKPYHVSCRDERKEETCPSISETSLKTPTLTPGIPNKVQINSDIRAVDVTDCSELEDFIASEVEEHIRLPPTVEEHELCITEVSTPNLSIPESSFSDKRGRPEMFSQVVESIKGAEVGLQVVPEDFSNSGKSFDFSEMESSLCSVVEIISEGELLRSEEKSPGEISSTLNNSFRRDVCMFSSEHVE